MKKGYILMLENDEHDMETSKRYFDEQNIRVEFLRSSNEVFPFLQRAEINYTLPSVILLSMNSLPDNGLTVLKRIKTSNGIKQIPTIILGENTQPELKNACYANGANTFFNKPFSDHLTDSTIRSFIHYWFEAAELPTFNSAISPVSI